MEDYSLTCEPIETLPTPDEAKEFLRLINVGREAIGLDKLEKLDFDACEPDDPENCLSAHHLFAHAGFSVGSVDLYLYLSRDPEKAEAVADALSLVPFDNESGEHYYYIPAAIRRVTDPFDSRHPGLRDRLEEAGVV